jgi:hypothetical protein
MFASIQPHLLASSSKDSWCDSKLKGGVGEFVLKNLLSGRTHVLILHGGIQFQESLITVSIKASSLNRVGAPAADN